MKNYIEMKAAGAAGVRFKKGAASIDNGGMNIIEHWRHVYSDVNGRRVEDRVDERVCLHDLETDIQRLQEDIKDKEDRIKNLMAVASDIKELEFSQAFKKTEIGISHSMPNHTLVK